MPLYEYECKKCGSVFEVLQRLSDPALTVHDHCGGVLEKLLSPPAFQFKGSGWYVTDYAKGSSTRSGGKDNKKDEKPAAPEVKKDTTSKPSAGAKPA